MQPQIQNRFIIQDGYHASGLKTVSANKKVLEMQIFQFYFFYASESVFEQVLLKEFYTDQMER